MIGGMNLCFLCRKPFFLNSLNIMSSNKNFLLINPRVWKISITAKFAKRNRYYDKPKNLAITGL